MNSKTDTQTASSCLLCQVSLKEGRVKHGQESFCCHGCMAVYQILKSQGKLDKDFQHTPTFQQALKHGLISNKELLKQLSDKASDAQNSLFKLDIEILDMWCYSCSKLIEYALMQEKGVYRIFVDYTTDLGQIQYDPKAIQSQEILEKLKQLGYEAINLQDAQEEQKHSSSLRLRLFIGIFFTLNVMMFSYPVYASAYHPEKEGYAFFFATLAAAFSLPVLLYTATPIWRRLFKGMAYGLYGMELLVGIGVFSAFSLSCFNLLQGKLEVYFDSMSVILTLVVLGKMIERKAKFSARGALVKLHKSLAKKGRFLRGDEEVFDSLQQVRVGDILIAYKGEKLPLDGVLLSDEAYLDEAPLTGESYPRRKTRLQAVLSGTYLLSEKIRYRVSKVAEQSVLYQIVECLQQDLHHKTPYLRAVEKILFYFVPVVLTLAFATAGFYLVVGFFSSQGVDRAHLLDTFLSILLISCPCAIGIAAPLAEACMIQSLVAMGVVVRNRGALGVLPQLTHFCFDKTGTLTEGRLSLIQGLEGLSEEETSTLKAMASHSSHPICRCLEERLFLPASPLKEVEEVMGKGVRAKNTQGKAFFLGSKSFLKDQGLIVEEKGQELLCFFASEKKLLATLHFEDKVRESFKGVMTQLGHSCLLSGDRQEVVDRVAKELGIGEAKGNCMPLEKKQLLQSWQQKGKKVAFIGDGVNDAPALTVADVGISMLKASDISIQVSDIFITKEDGQLIPKLLSTAKLGKKILTQNLFWAFFYNVIGIFLAMAGLLWPLYAALAMGLSSLMICFNSLRIKRI